MPKGFSYILALVMCIATTPLTASAQMKMTSLALGSGEDPITSGMSITGDFSPVGGKKIVEVALQSEQAWLAAGTGFGKPAGLNGTLVANIDEFQGSINAGPRFTLDMPLTKKIHADLIEWPGWFFSNPDSRKGQKFDQPIGQYGGVSLTVGSLTFSEGQQRFLRDRTNFLPGISYGMHIMPNVSSIASATYNQNGRRWLYYIGATWTPPST